MLAKVVDAGGIPHGLEARFRTDSIERGTMDPRRRDALAGAAARAHRDAEPDDGEAAPRHGRDRRTLNHWANGGPPAVRHHQRYLLAVADPWRLVAETKTTAKHRTVSSLDRDALIERYHELRRREKAVEGEDNGADVCRGVCWLDRAAAKERDAAVNEELAAVMREFASRGITEAEVWEHPSATVH